MPRTTTFSVTRDDVIKAALRKLKVIGEGETPSTEDYTNCAFALNMMVKSWEMDGYYLWKLTEIPVPTVAANESYQIGDTATGTGAVVTNRPVRIQDTCYVRDTTSNIDTPILIISKQEYNHLSDKTASGIPNQVYYDPQLTNGVLYMYPSPSDATHTVYVTAQIPVYDFSSGSESLDFPQEGYQAVVYGLAEEVMLEYPRLPGEDKQLIVQRAQYYRERLADWSQEEASVYFTPSSRG